MPVSHINIVSFDVPYPPDYGGVMDVFYKIKALHDLGIKIILHCFEYGRSEQKELEPYCEKIIYYKRKTSLINQFSLWPYIVYSRKNKSLLENLNSNTYPVLLEGMHSAYYLLSNQLNGRVVLLRTHNIEHDYYRYLGKREKNPIRKIYYYKEALLLEKAIDKIPSETIIFAISQTDQAFFKKRFPNSYWLPPFHSNNAVKSLPGKGKYALYHGNLSVSENAEGAEYLIRAFSHQKVRLVIAGKNPPQKLMQRSRKIDNIEIIANPNARSMNDLIQNAHVVLLPAFQPTGIKLKLLESLYKGRFCVANAVMTKGTMLEKLVVTAEHNFFEKTAQLMNERFSEEIRDERESVLSEYYNNQLNVMLIVKYLEH